MFGTEIAARLWVEEFRPNTVDDYIFKNSALKKVVQNWISSGDLPHLLLHGPAGTGKTSLIHVLINSIEKLDKGDVMELNMSDEGVDAIRDKILPFVQTIGFGAYKVVILEEFEQCSHKGQGSLKRIMEEYSDVARFVITSNEPNKILPPIRSRCQEIQIESHDKEEFLSRGASILLEKGATNFDELAIARLQKYSDACWPDFRKFINTLQQNFVNGELIELNTATSGTANFESQLIAAIQNNNLSACRKQIVESVRDDQVSDFFSFLYRNTDLWIPAGTDSVTAEKMRMKIILAARDGIVNDTLVADRELNMSATLVACQFAILELM